MKILAIANQKGGVGKSALTCQLAYYAALKRNLRTLVIDLDHQGNATTALSMGDHAQVAALPASKLFTDTATLDDNAPLTVIGADASPLRNLESEGDRHNEFVTNLSRSLTAMGEQFDLCIIDVNPSPDVRHIGALIVADYIVSPIQLTRESIDGITALIYDPEIGINKIRDALNPTLVMLGLIPNMIEQTRFQVENLHLLYTQHQDLLIPIPKTEAETTADAEKVAEGKPTFPSYARIPKSAAIFEAQSAGVPLWEMKSSTGYSAHGWVRRVSEQLLANMELTEQLA